MKQSLFLFIAGLFFLGLGVSAQSNNQNEFYDNYRVAAGSGGDYNLDMDFGKDQVTIFGVSVKAKDFILVMDRTGSMTSWSYKSGYTRWALLKSEFNKTIDGLKNDQKYNAVLFNTGYSYLLGGGTTLYPKVQKSTPPTADILWGEIGKSNLNSYSPSGNTNLQLGFEKAIPAQGNVDAIIVVTDGETNTGPTATYKGYTGRLGSTLKYVDENVTKQVIAIWVGGSLSSTYYNFMKLLANAPKDDGSLPNPSRPAGMFVIPGQQ